MKTMPRRGWLTIPLLLVAAVLAMAVGALFLLERLPAPAPFSFAAPPKRTTTSTDGVIKELQALNRLETAAFTTETIVESDNAGSRLQNLLYRDRMLLVAHGRVVAGIDLSTLSREDVVAGEGALTVTLSAPQILSVTLDSSKTRVYDRTLGLLSKGDKDLETMVRRTAEDAIRRSACQAHILDEAGRQARAVVSRMFTLAGFYRVTVNVAKGSCA